MTGPGDAPLALISGSHSRLGGHIALGLMRTGYDVAVHGSHDVTLEPWLANAFTTAGKKWSGFVADFENPTETTRLVTDVAAHFGRAPDLLVNSAAIFGQDRLETVEADDLIRHYRVNCVAPVLLTRAFAEAPASGQVPTRCIVNILDQRLANPHGDQLSYTLAKQALAGFTQIAARELAAKSIRVNAVAPGLTIAVDSHQADQLERIRTMMPLGNLPSPQEIADAVCYLAKAPSVTGQVLVVDGGAHMTAFPRDFLYL